MGNGEEEFDCATAAAIAFVQFIRYAVPKRAAGTITLYNPAASNAQVRNVTRATDATGTAAANGSLRGFRVGATGAAGWIAGDNLALNWQVDSAL